MRKTLRTLAFLAAVAIAAPVIATPSHAQECDGMRSFTGIMQKHKRGKRGSFVLDNRMGDKVKFQRGKETKVTDKRGGDKPITAYDGLSNGLYVTACWKFTDKPRKAYDIYVLTPPPEKGEDQ